MLTAGSQDAHRLLLLGLLCLTFGTLFLLVTRQAWVPISAFGVSLLLGSLLLPLRLFLVLLAAQAASVGTALVVLDVTPLRVATVVVLSTLAMVMVVAVCRNRLGATGESMLIDLRDRLNSQSELPPLPPGWSAEAVMRSAGGAQFAGDFIVAAKTQRGDAVEIVVVDVSGKGLAAGTRALLLSGAFGGLLGALPAEQFLPAANNYLLRQEWSEGFATAAHLSLRLCTGHFELRTAGHPPGVQLHAGSGRWQVHSSSGPALGLFAEAEFVPTTGQLQHGDALMLFTDGLVETAERDFTLGIDKLLGEAERMGREGFTDGARRLLDRLEVSTDDRALVFVHRQ
ncbi:hypothetical protein BH20ACT6_BH20ACT6_02790 [soil metagenome]